jgi:hypothetical protein
MREWVLDAVWRVRRLRPLLHPVRLLNEHEELRRRMIGAYVMLTNHPDDPGWVKAAWRELAKAFGDPVDG